VLGLGLGLELELGLGLGLGLDRVRIRVRAGVSVNTFSIKRVFDQVEYRFVLFTSFTDILRLVLLLRLDCSKFVVKF